MGIAQSASRRRRRDPHLGGERGRLRRRHPDGRRDPDGRGDRRRHPLGRVLVELGWIRHVPPRDGGPRPRPRGRALGRENASGGAHPGAPGMISARVPYGPHVERFAGGLALTPHRRARRLRRTGAADGVRRGGRDLDGGAVVLDLTAVTFLDSTALGTIVGLLRRVARGGRGAPRRPPRDRGAAHLRADRARTVARHPPEPRERARR